MNTEIPRRVGGRSFPAGISRSPTVQNWPTKTAAASAIWSSWWRKEATSTAVSSLYTYPNTHTSQAAHDLPLRCLSVRVWVHTPLPCAGEQTCWLQPPPWHLLSASQCPTGRVCMGWQATCWISKLQNTLENETIWLVTLSKPNSGSEGVGMGECEPICRLHGGGWRRNGGGSQGRRAFLREKGRRGWK